MFNRTVINIAAAALLAFAAAAASGQAQRHAHPMLTPADVKWGPAPPALPAGAEVAVLDGDPFKPGFFSIRLKMPDGYKIAPHWHPTDENVVVLQGLLSIGMGDTLNAGAAKKLPVGSFTRLPKEMRHFAIATGETVLQIYGDGPFVLNYVNPKDDPSKKPTAQ